MRGQSAWCQTRLTLLSALVGEAGAGMQHTQSMLEVNRTYKPSWHCCLHAAVECTQICMQNIQGMSTVHVGYNHTCVTTGPHVVVQHTTVAYNSCCCQTRSNTSCLSLTIVLLFSPHSPQTIWAQCVGCAARKVQQYVCACAIKGVSADMRLKEGIQITSN